MWIIHVHFWEIRISHYVTSEVPLHRSITYFHITMFKDAITKRGISDKQVKIKNQR